MHDGKVWVESQLEEGSLFHIMLPFAAKASPEIGRTREESPL
jgi:signal transduction histidine kinase